MNKLSLVINNQNVDVPNQLPQYSNGTDINDILGFLVSMLMIVAIIACLAYLIWGGIDFITSTGDKNKKNSAKNRIVYSIVGLVISLLAIFFVQGIQSILNFKFF